MAPLIFSHCHACAENDEGMRDCDPGVGCPANGPSEGCEAVWIEARPNPHQQEDKANG